MSTISEDLAVHGLAYLGVLLVFAGVFGFVALSFADVEPRLRPVAEAIIPLAFFLAAWMLRRRGIHFVSSALELLGGALLPVVLIASLSDGFDVPPDLHGTALVLSLTIAMVVLASAYALIALRHPGSSLRYLVGPVAWLAVAAVGLLFAGEIPVGEALSHPVPAQWALVSIAVAATVWMCRGAADDDAAPLASLRRATIAAAIPGVVLAALLTFLSAATSGWPAAPIAVAGVATILSLEGLAIRFDQRFTCISQAVALYATALALVPGLEIAWAAAVAAMGALVLLEWQLRRRPTVDSMIVLSAWLPGLVAGLLGALMQPWPTITTWTTVWIWAVARRVRPARSIPAAVVAAGVVAMPLGIGVGLADLTSIVTSLVVLAAVLVLGALIVGVSGDEDDLWAWSIPGAGAILLLFVAGSAQSTATSAPTQTDLVELALAAALVAVAFAVAPRWPVLRVWSAAVATAGALALVADAWSWSRMTVVLLAAVIGVVLVAMAAAIRPSGRGHLLVGHVGLIGHLVGIAAVLFAPGPSAGTSTTQMLVLASCFVGWALTTLMQETIGSNVVDLLCRVASTPSKPGPEAAETSKAPWTVRTVVAIPAVMATALFIGLVPTSLDALVVSAQDTPWLWFGGLVAVLVVAACARLVVSSHRRLAGLALNTAIVLGVALLGLTHDLVMPLGASLLIGAVVVAGPTLRRAYMLWVAWLASAFGVGSLAAWLGVEPDAIRYVMLGWGAAALVGGLALDDRMAGRRHLGELVRRPSQLPPVVLGAITATAALATCFDQSMWRYGWASAFAAAVVLVVAWQLRWGILTLVSWLLATVAFAALAPWEPMSEPWTFVPLLAVMVVVSELLRARVSEAWTSRDQMSGEVHWWAWFGRWDIAALVAAHAVGSVALVAALDVGQVTATWCGIGAIAIVLDIRRRVGLWAVAGTGLVLVGAGYAGWGWLSLALAATSVASGVLAERLDDRWRIALELSCVSAAAGSYAAALAWWEADLQLAATASAVASVVVALGLAVAMRVRRIDRTWIIVWAGLLPIGLTYSSVALAAPGIEPSPTGQLLALAVAVTALPTALAARRFELPWFRELAALVLAAAGWPLAYGTQATPTAIGLVAGAVALVAAAASGMLLSERTRSWRAWLRPALMLASVGLVVATIAGAEAGPGWLCLALIEVAVLTSIAGLVTSGTVRLVCTAMGVTATVGAAISFAAWVGWSLETEVVASALAVAVLSLVLGLITRVPRVDRIMIGLWTTPVAAGLAFAATSLSSPEVDRWPAGGAVALAFAAGAVALAIAATPLGLDGMRELAAVMFVAAGGSLAYGIDATPTQVVVVSALVGTLMSLVAAAIEGTGDEQLRFLRPWARSALAVAAISALTSIAVAADLLPQRPVLVASLLLLGLDLATLGLAGRRPVLLTASPVPIGLAWLVFASEALEGNPQWFTVPVGVTLLTVVGLARWQRRRAGLDPLTAPIVLLELLGCLLVVSASLMQIVVDNIAYGLLAVLLGALIAGWGVLTRVRRRLVFGAATIALAVALMVLVPLVGLIPEAGSPALWLTVAAAGLVAIVVAAFIEQGRNTVLRMAKSFRQLTEGWEGWTPQER